MVSSQIREFTVPDYVSPIIEADSLEALCRACRSTARGIIGEDRVRQSVLLMLRGKDRHNGLVINQHTVLKRRFFKPYLIDDDLIERLHHGEEISPAGDALRKFILTNSDFANAPEIIDESMDLMSLRDEGIGQVALLPLIHNGVPVGAWILTLNTAVEDLTPSMQEHMQNAASRIGLVFESLMRYEEIQWRNDQLRHIFDALNCILVCTDRNTLFSTCLNIMTRYYGFERVAIMMVNPESQTLRNEQHTGFEESFMPHPVPMDSEEDFFVNLLQGGSPVVCRSFESLPARLPSFGFPAAIERCIILPLRIGSKPLGLIYADQSQHNGVPFFNDVLEVLARLVSAAYENMTQRIQAEERAEHDALTGLYNRYYMDKILQFEIPRVKRYNHTISLLMIDLVGFKHTNDTYGHQFGDYILKETANLLEHSVRRPDVVVRYGGDEFVVLMANTTEDQARLVCDRIERAFIERNRHHTDPKLMIDISLGLRSANAENIDSLLAEADKAMYIQKSRQRRLSLIEALVAGDLEYIEKTDKMVGSLCNMLYKKAPYYIDHARRVTHLAIRIARALGLPDDEVETLALASLLHDVGKVSLPTALLQKEGPLTADEKQAMRSHPLLGEEFFEGLEHLEPIRPVIRAHHERYDGQIEGEFPGYPQGICGERIPLAARILKLTESLDCMLWSRSYRAAPLSLEAAREELLAESGKSFDPRLVRTLLSIEDWSKDLGDIDALLRLVRFSMDPATE